MRKSAPKNQRITWLNAPLVTDKKPPPANDSGYILSAPAHNARATRKSSRGRSDAGVVPADSTADPSAEQTSRKRAHSAADVECDGAVAVVVALEQNEAYEFECEHGCGFDGPTMQSVEVHEKKCAQSPEVQLELSRILAAPVKTKAQKNTEKKKRQRARKQAAAIAAAAAAAADAGANGGEDSVAEYSDGKHGKDSDYADDVGGGSPSGGSDGGGGGGEGDGDDVAGAEVEQEVEHEVVGKGTKRKAAARSKSQQRVPPSDGRPGTTCKKLKSSTPAATSSAVAFSPIQPNTDLSNHVVVAAAAADAVGAIESATPPPPSTPAIAAPPTLLNLSGEVLQTRDAMLGAEFPAGFRANFAKTLMCVGVRHITTPRGH